MSTGNENQNAAGLYTSVISINTDKTIKDSGRIQDLCGELRRKYRTIPSERNELTSYNRNGCITKELQDLYNAEASFFKHVGQLETAAVVLANIAISYDNAEQLLLGNQTRKLIVPTEPPVIPPFNPNPASPDEKKDEKEDKKDDKKDDSGKGGSDEGKGSGSGSTEKKEIDGWKWRAAQWTDKDEDPEWYNWAFDKAGKLSFGKIKTVNCPEHGSYKHQTKQNWNVGITVMNKGNKKDLLEDTKYQKQILPNKGSAKFAPQKVGTFFEVGVDYGVSWTGMGARTFKNDDYIKYNAEAYMGRAQFNAHAGLGAFKFKDKDGRLVNGYGLSANCGASFTAFGAAASGDLGSAYAGVMGSASAAVGEVYGKGDLTVGMVDGKFVAALSGAVGANAFSASVSGGARILGAEVQAGASFTVGIGAKFSVGFEGGKFKANIGATLGLGFEVNISVDFSKCISVVKDIGKNIVNWIRRW